MTQWPGQQGRPRSGSLPGGCLLQFTAIGSIALGAGFYLLNNWSGLGGIGRTAAVILVIIGTLVMIPVALAMIVLVVVNRLQKRLARQISELGARMDTRRHAASRDYREARADDFSATDRSFYQQTEQALASAGFTKLGGIVDATVEDAGSFSPVIEVMVAHGGTTSAHFYDLSGVSLPDKIHRRGSFVIELITEFSGTSFLVTTNTQGIEDADSPPTITRRQFPHETPVLTLIEAHEREKAGIIAAHPDKNCMVVQSMADALASENRLKAVKKVWRDRNLPLLEQGDE